MQAVLMVAGKSTRTYPLTLTRPKPLLSIANHFIIKHSLDQLVGLFEEVVLIVGYRQEMIRSAMGQSYRGIRIIYQEQKEQLGTGHAILQARPHIRSRFLAMNGDDLFAHEDLKRLVELPNAALAKSVPNPSQYGIFQVDDSGRVINLVEKPKEYIGDLVNVGCYVFEPEIFDEIERTPLSERGEIEITSAILSLAKRKEVKVLPITGFWLPTGYAWDLLKHQEFLMSSMTESDVQGEIEPGATLKGPVRVGKGTIIRAGAYIEGPVVIGDGCDIGPSCYVRKYTAIGNGCRIGNAVEIKNSVIMDSCRISHLSYVGDSVIGEGCNLGAGTITANRRHDGGQVFSMIKNKLVDSGREKLGAILADGVSTGIHTSIYPGRKLWPNTNTRPGEIVEKDIAPDNQVW
jgi:UDP-N-acetylglucosamine diphosphorylase/glucosamine-1-phosphate N-acetyltransferase